MRTMIFAAVAALSLGLGSAAFANDGGYGGRTLFTSIPGVLAQAPAQNQPSAAANGQVGVYGTTSNSGTWLFPPAVNGGGNS